MTFTRAAEEFIQRELVPKLRQHMYAYLPGTTGEIVCKVEHDPLREKTLLTLSVQHRRTHTLCQEIDLMRAVRSAKSSPQQVAHVVEAMLSYHFGGMAQQLLTTLEERDANELSRPTVAFEALVEMDRALSQLELAVDV